MAFGNKNSTPSFVLTLPMKVTKQDEFFLSKRFRVGCTVYNQMVTKTTKMWHQLRKTREYKNLIKAIKAAPAKSDERKALLVQRSNLIKQASFSEGAFHKLVVPYQKAYNVNCDIAQKVASAVWKAWDDFFYGKGKTVHYKKLDDFVTLSGKKNNSGIFFRPANHTVSSMESAKRKAKNSIEKKYFDAYRKPDAKKDEEVVLPDEVKAQMDKEVADATAKIKPYIGEGNLRIIYEKHEFLVKVRNPDTQTGWYQQEALKCGVKYCRIFGHFALPLSFALGSKYTGLSKDSVSGSFTLLENPVTALRQHRIPLREGWEYVNYTLPLFSYRNGGFFRKGDHK